MAVKTASVPSVEKQKEKVWGCGMSFERKNTHHGANPLDEIEYAYRKSVITNPDGSVVFKMDNVEVPAEWRAPCSRRQESRA